MHLKQSFKSIAFFTEPKAMHQKQSFWLIAPEGGNALPPTGVIDCPYIAYITFGYVKKAM